MKENCSQQPADPNAGQRTNRRSFLMGLAGFVVLAIAVLVAAFLLFGEVKERLGFLWAVVLFVVVPLGALWGQAKDVALKTSSSGRVLQDLFYALRTAYTSDEHGPAFLFRLLEWTALAIAAALISVLIASSGSKLKIPEGTELTLPTETELNTSPGGDITLPKGTKLTLHTEIEVTLPPEIKLIVPTATPGQ